MECKDLTPAFSLCTFLHRTLKEHSMLLIETVEEGQGEDQILVL